MDGNDLDEIVFADSSGQVYVAYADKLVGIEGLRLGDSVEIGGIKGTLLDTEKEGDGNVVHLAQGVVIWGALTEAGLRRGSRRGSLALLTAGALTFWKNTLESVFRFRVFDRPDDSRLRALSTQGMQPPNLATTPGKPRPPG